MDDTVAARREARRRRILENSQNRLQIITGKTCDASQQGNFAIILFLLLYSFYRL